MTEQSKYRAIVLGATGAVGSSLTRALLASPLCESVTLLNRRKTEQFAGVEGASKLIQIVVDIDKLETEAVTPARGCSVAFCTLGAGQPSKLPPGEHWKIDVGYAGAFARACRQAGVQHITLLCAVGADPNSGNAYLKVKGNAEAAIRAPGFARTSSFRPSLLVTPQLRYGLWDQVMQYGFPLVSWLMPSRFHQVRVEDLGRAMQLNAERPGSGDEVLHYRDFMNLLAKQKRLTA